MRERRLDGIGCQSLFSVSPELECSSAPAFRFSFHWFFCFLFLFCFWLFFLFFFSLLAVDGLAFEPFPPLLLSFSALTAFPFLRDGLMAGGLRRGDGFGGGWD